jgi:molecular chaperone HscB
MTELKPLSPETNYFRYLLEAETLNVNPADLTRRFHQASLAVHPDRFTTRGAEQQGYSVDHAEYLNQAYKTLKDPLARARYFLSLHGKDEPADKRVPVALAEQYFEMQELVADAESGSEDEREEILGQVAALSGQLQEAREALEKRLQQAFESWDAGGGDRDSLLTEMATILYDHRYASSMLADIHSKFQR